MDNCLDTRTPFQLGYLILMLGAVMKPSLISLIGEITARNRYINNRFLIVKLGGKIACT